MQAPLSTREYQRLELIPSPDLGPDPHPAQTQNWLNRWTNAVLAYFNSSSEPHVRQVNRKGQIVWRVYDPVSRRHHEFTSELELRIWLEERYYQPAVGL